MKSIMLCGRFYRVVPLTLSRLERFMRLNDLALDYRLPDADARVLIAMAATVKLGLDLGRWPASSYRWRRIRKTATHRELQKAFDAIMKEWDLKRDDPQSGGN